MHLKRWLTSLVAFPLLVLLIFYGGLFLFSIVMGLVTFLSMWEFSRIVASNNDRTTPNTITNIGILSGIAVIAATSYGLLAIVPIILSFSLITAGFFSFRRFQNDPEVSRKVAFQLLGIVYIPLSISYLILIRQDSFGAEWVLFIICIIFAGDTAAYYVGSYWGKHKLCPAVSPGKTIEGAVGGIAANIGIGIIFKSFFFTILPLWSIILFCLLIGVAGQAGDLFESVLKRAAGIKDSGALLPGHGGILDRIDAILFALPVAYFLKLALFAQHAGR